MCKYLSKQRRIYINAMWSIFISYLRLCIHSFYLTVLLALHSPLPIPGERLLVIGFRCNSPARKQSNIKRWFFCLCRVFRRGRKRGSMSNRQPKQGSCWLGDFAAWKRGIAGMGPPCHAWPTSNLPPALDLTWDWLSLWFALEKH